MNNLIIKKWDRLTIYCMILSALFGALVIWFTVNVLAEAFMFTYELNTLEYDKAVDIVSRRLLDRYGEVLRESGYYVALERDIENSFIYRQAWEHVDYVRSAHSPLFITFLGFVYHRNAQVSYIGQYICGLTFAVWLLKMIREAYAES